MIKGFAHIAFIVSDMKESLKFYCDVLGFKHVFDIKNDNGDPWIEYIKIHDDQFVELFYGDPKRDKNQSYSHLCLEVDDINEIAQKIKFHGYELLEEPQQGKDMNYQCWAQDPDGNRIEFMQISDDSPQKKSN